MRAACVDGLIARGIVETLFQRIAENCHYFVGGRRGALARDQLVDGDSGAVFELVDFALGLAVEV